jgi:plastocyanin
MMQRSVLRKILIGLAAISGTPTLCAVPTGAVTGQVPLPVRPTARFAVEKYAGSISGRVGPPPPWRAGVWIEGPGLAAPAAPPRVVLSQKDYQFAQSLVIVPRGTTVEFPNDDPDYHNVFSLSRVLRFDLGRYKKSEVPPPAVTFPAPGVVRLQCEIHEHMRAVVLVVDSPFCVATDAAGRFTLTGLPPGRYTLRAQLDEKTQWATSITVVAGRTTSATFVDGTLAAVVR